MRTGKLLASFLLVGIQLPLTCSDPALADGNSDASALVLEIVPVQPPATLDFHLVACDAPLMDGVRLSYSGHINGSMFSWDVYLLDGRGCIALIEPLAGALDLESARRLVDYAFGPHELGPDESP